jgi:hypothetical protein
MLTQASSSNQREALQITQAARFRKLFKYVNKPHYFLVYRTYRTALHLSRIPQHFSNSKNHNYKR